MGGECGCGGGCGCSGFQRKVHTTEEKLMWMKEYQKDLETEIKAVKEKIAWLEKKR
jgi:hypothetical protein